MRIKIHGCFIPYLLCITILSSYSVCIGVITALFIHELSHYMACRVVGEQIELLELTPLGGMMTYKPDTIPSKGLKGILVHAAGPLGNYAAMLLISIATRNVQLSSFLYSAMSANASMLLVNLLPAFPLDGGQILFCLGYYLFPVARLVGWLSVAGIMLGFSGLLLCIYGLVSQGLLNCSLLIVSIHMMFSASKQCRQRLAENIYTVVQERLCETIKVKKLIHYQVAPDTPLLELISLLKENIGIRFVFAENGRSHELDERTFCCALLDIPNGTIQRAYQNTPQYQEKS